MREFSVLEPIATRQHGLLTSAQLTAAGVGRRQVDAMVARNLLVRRGRGVVRLAGSRQTWEQNVMAATLTGPSLAIASHRSALRLWGFRTVDDVIEVSVRHPVRISVPGAIVHRSRDIDRADVTWIDGIPVTAPARALTDAGLIFPEAEVARMVRHAVASGLVTSGDLWKVRIRVGKQGRNGAGVLGSILERLPKVASQAESGPEVLLIEICERFGLASPTPQFVVRTRGRIRRVDLGYPEERVFIEFDGAEFHSEPEQIAADGGRQNDLVVSGWIPLRFTYADLVDRPAHVAAQIRHALAICAPKRTA